MSSVILLFMTHHVINSSLDYCGSLHRGTITNSGIALMYDYGDIDIGLLLGTDSTCSPIVGSINKYKLSNNVGFVFGAYNYNRKEFEKRNLDGFYVGNITPFIGINYDIRITGRIYLANFISPVIITHGIRIDL